MAISAALCAALVGCHASAPRVIPPPRALPAPEVHPEDDAYDLHSLLIAPFGSALKDIPIVLHEVLMFRDDTHGGTTVDDAECYAAEPPAPRFIERAPDEYLLCFKNDRLSRIQASLRVTAAEASDVFAAACTRWLRHAQPVAAARPAASAAANQPGAEVPSAAACEGNDQSVHFRGWLAQESDPSDAAQGASVLSVTLDSAPGP